MLIPLAWWNAFLWDMIDCQTRIDCRRPWGDPTLTNGPHFTVFQTWFFNSVEIHWIPLLRPYLQGSNTGSLMKHKRSRGMEESINGGGGGGGLWDISWLTYWGRGKFVAMSQTFSNAFSLIKIYGIRLQVHWNLLRSFELIIFQHSSLIQKMAWRRPGDKPLCEPMMFYWRISMSLGFNELINTLLVNGHKQYQSVCKIKN